MLTYIMLTNLLKVDKSKYTLLTSPHSTDKKCLIVRGRLKNYALVKMSLARSLITCLQSYHSSTVTSLICSLLTHLQSPHLPAVSPLAHSLITHRLIFCSTVSSPAVSLLNSLSYRGQTYFMLTYTMLTNLL